MTQNAAKPKSCRTCAYLIVTPDADGKRRARKGNYYLCSFDVEQAVAMLPVSITSSSWFCVPDEPDTTPDDGATCPCHSPPKGA